MIDNRSESLEAGVKRDVFEDGFWVKLVLVEIHDEIVPVTVGGQLGSHPGARWQGSSLPWDMEVKGYKRNNEEGGNEARFAKDKGNIPCILKLKYTCLVFKKF